MVAGGFKVDEKPNVHCHETNYHQVRMTYPWSHTAIQRNLGNTSKVVRVQSAEAEKCPFDCSLERMVTTNIKALLSQNR